MHALARRERCRQVDAPEDPRRRPPPRRGQITLGGEPFEQGRTRRAREQGVAVIYQEPSLFPDLSLAENVFVGRQPRTAATGVDWPAMRERAAALFERLGVHLDPRPPAAGLSIADQQIVEIAKAL